MNKFFKIKIEEAQELPFIPSFIYNEYEYFLINDFNYEFILNHTSNKEKEIINNFISIDQKEYFKYKDNYEKTKLIK